MYIRSMTVFLEHKSYEIILPVIFVLRLYSIYGGSKVIVSTMTLLLLAELAVKIVS